MARASSPSLEAVLGDVPQESDLELALSMDDLPPPPPTRSGSTSIGNELSDLLKDIPAEQTKPHVTPKPKPKPQTKSDIIMRDIYKLLAEIERDIELNLTPRNKLAKSDTFGMTNVIQSITPATKSPVRNADPPPIKSKPKPVTH